MSEHNKYMKRCLELAAIGLGKVAPNPMVGAVIVHNDLIIGEGYHEFYGGPHAEVNAISSVKDSSLLKDSTIYVNLEPCSHFGKTPPCADLIISKGFKRVVIGTIDTFPSVSGKGIEKLKQSGIEVLINILEDECRMLNKRFFTFHEKKRPFIILKWAQTADGFIDVIRKSESKNRPTWITDEIARTLVHKWRTEEQGIMVGTNTVIADNPKLNARLWPGKNPVRLILDRNLRIPHNLYVFDESQRTIVFTEKDCSSTPNLQYVKIDFNHTLIDQIMKNCYENKLQSVIVEGGAQLINSFIEAGIWDEARVFYSFTTFIEGIKAPKIPIQPAVIEVFKNFELKYFKSTRN